MDDRSTPTKQEEIRCVHLASGDLWAGAEVQIYNLVSRLHTIDGITPHAVLLNDGELAERLRAAGVPVTVLDERRMSAWRIFREVVRIIRRERIGIVHSHRRKEQIIGTLAARLTRCSAVRTIHGRSEHPPARWDLRRRLLKRLDDATARLQQRVIAVSEVLGGELEATLPRGRVLVIPNGVDLAAVQATAATASRPPLTQRPMEIAVVGRLVPVKRVDLVIDIAAHLEQASPGAFQFHIYGDGPLRAALEARARAALPETVLSFAGFRSDVLERLASHDALLITSDHEGLPTNLLEALALGKPVVARRVGEIPLVLGESLAEYCVDASLPAPFAARLAALRDDLTADTVDRQQLYARATAYSAEACSERHAALYRSLVQAADDPRKPADA